MGCYCCSKLRACRPRCQLTGQQMDSKRRRSSIQCIVARVSVRVRPVERVDLKTASARHRKLELRLRCNRPQVGRCVAVFVCLSPGAFNRASTTMCRLLRSDAPNPTVSRYIKTKRIEVYKNKVQCATTYALAGTLMCSLTCRDCHFRHPLCVDLLPAHACSISSGHWGWAPPQI